VGGITVDPQSMILLNSQILATATQGQVARSQSPSPTAGSFQTRQPDLRHL
jgi:hypothetical protein